MAAPINPPWALNLLTGLEAPVVGGGIKLYDNRAEPPLEIQAYGILHNVPLGLQEINYQFYSLYAFNEWVRKKQEVVINETATSRTLTPSDFGNYIRFTQSSACTYTINAGTATIGDKVIIRQAGSGVVTLTQGMGTVTFNVRAGFTAKTSGVGSTITLVKVASGSGTESWDVFGDLGV
jgi:hypothetical protein